MNDLPRQLLCELLQKHGPSICEEPQRCEGLLRDKCRDHNREIIILVNALRQNVAIDILSQWDNVPHAALLKRLAKRLHDNLGTAENFAWWAVESWALALGKLSFEESQKRVENESNDKIEKEFKKYVRFALKDGILSLEEKRNLLNEADTLQIEPFRAEEIIGSEMAKIGATEKTAKPESKESHAPPKLRLSHRSLDFNGMKKDSTISNGFTVSNIGDSPLNVIITADMSWLKLIKSTVNNINDSEHIEFEIVTNGLSNGFKGRGIIEVKSNGGTEKIFINISVASAISQQKTGAQQKMIVTPTAPSLKTISYSQTPSSDPPIDMRKGKKRIKPISSWIPWVIFCAVSGYLIYSMNFVNGSKEKVGETVEKRANEARVAVEKKAVPQRSSNAVSQGANTFRTAIQPGPEGKDTFFGTAYVTDGGPGAAELSIGGWGDNYYDFLEFDLSRSPQSTHVAKAEVWLYGSAPNDPILKIYRITQSWTETGVTRSNNPTSTFYKNMPPVPSAPGWIITDITDLYKGWKDGLFPNHGIKLSPTSTNQTNGSIASSDNLDPNLRPKLVITMTTSQSRTQTDKKTFRTATPQDESRFTVTKIDTDPSKATVFIDGQQRGRTPLYNLSIPVDDKTHSHIIRFELERHKMESIVIKDGQKDFPIVTLSQE